MLDANFFERLNRLRLGMTYKSTQSMSGNRKSSQKGISAEFSDFRPYMQGDDLRRLDWNAYARLDKLYIREYMEEKETLVTVLIDTSASMDFGEPNKKELAMDLAKVISFLALSNMDRLMLYDMKHMEKGFLIGGGKQAFAKACKWLEKLEFGGEIHSLDAVKKMKKHASGMTVVISDFLMEGMLSKEKPSPEEAPSLERLLQYLRFCKQRPVILHTLSPQELRTDLIGALNLIDVETKVRLRLTVDARAISRYEKALSVFLTDMQRTCRKNQSTYILCDSGKKRDELVFHDLRVIYDI